ncbi:unnamed protein product [Rotaria socialis]|uniref:Uncharacterized protein n=1 Tax=Rotaria socialis TaxID=392032 RepID=A0A821L1F0_9BILA|nr:unnamed protein product [Rotaria socialis]
MPNYLNLEEANGPSGQYKSKTFSSTSMHPVVTKMRETSSLNSIDITRTKTRRSTDNKSNVTSKTSSSKKMLTGVMNYDGASSITALVVFLLTNKLTSTVTTRTSTTATSTSTTTTSTITTPAPPCVPNSAVSASSLYIATSSSTIAYRCFAYEWTSPTTGWASFAFDLLHDPDYSYLDDVLVYAGAVQMLTNTDFETSNLSHWIRTTSNGACGGAPSEVCNFLYHSENYSAYDGSNGCADQLSQQFMATSGEIYIVSCWLKSGSTGSVVSANITLSGTPSNKALNLSLTGFGFGASTTLIQAH